MSVRSKLFQSLEIDTYLLRKVSENTETNEQSDWSIIESHVRECTKCPLHKDRNNTVFGDGNTVSYTHLTLPTKA